jgi:hypothetical protein
MTEATSQSKVRPELLGYMVEVIFRAHSSGAETKVTGVCLSLKGASEWLMRNFEGYAVDMNYPEDWDVDDMKGAEFPDKSIFSEENLKKILETNKKKWYDAAIWGPESIYEAQVPTEFFIKEIPIYE